MERGGIDLKRKWLNPVSKAIHLSNHVTRRFFFKASLDSNFPQTFLIPNYKIFFG